MRIADILTSHAQPGTLVVDLTRPELKLGDELQLAIGVTYRRGLDGAHAERILLVCELADLTLDAGHDVGRSVVHVVVFDELAALHHAGTLERVSQAGWLVAVVDVTGHRGARFAMVLTRADERELGSHLRTVNEYRVRRLEQREQDHEIERAQHRIKQLEAELAAARRETSAMAERTDRVQHLLERARGSVGFRIGRATRVALRASPWTAPVTWVRTFRGEDEVIESLDPKRK